MIKVIDLRGVTTPEEAKRIMDAGLRPAVEVRTRWGNLRDEPTCEHGRIRGYCACWEGEGS